MPTRRLGRSRVLAANADANSWNAFRLPRTRFTGSTSPSSIERIGLMFSSSPANAARAADAAAAREVLERVDGEEQPALAAVALDELVDLLVGRAALEPALDREPEHRDRRRRGLGVDRRAPGRRRARAAAVRALSNVPESFAERCSEKIRS